MSYCVNCGVRLADSEARCPLCGVPVVNPAEPDRVLSEPPFPPQATHAASLRERRAALVSAAILLLIPLLSTLVCDLALNGEVTWSRFVVAGYLALYAFLFAPAAFRRHRVTYSILTDYAAVLLSLGLLNLYTGGRWFASFALPLTTVFGALIYTVYLLVRHTPWNMLKVGSAVLGGTGLFTLFTEWLINRTFYPGKTLLWSLFIMIPCVVVSIVFAIVDSSRELKQSVKRRFFF